MPFAIARLAPSVPLRMELAPAVTAVEPSLQQPGGTDRKPPRQRDAVLRLNLVIAPLSHDWLVLTANTVASVFHHADVERVLEHVLHRKRSEDRVPATRLEALGVQPASDLTHRRAVRAPFEGDLHRRALRGIGQRHCTRARCSIAKRHRSDGQAALRTFALALAHVHRELVGEELGDSPDHGEHELPGRRREIDVLGDARKPDVRFTETLQSHALDANVPRPAIDRVHDDNIEVPSCGALKQGREFGALLDLLRMSAHASGCECLAPVATWPGRSSLPGHVAHTSTHRTVASGRPTPVLASTGGVVRTVARIVTG